MSRVAVIILNWNNALDTLLCLRSVQESDYSDYQVFIVDNGSSEECIAAISAGATRAILVRNKENLGYAGGNNVGIRVALDSGADWVLILNNDATVASDCLSNLMQVTRELDDGGAFGPLVLHADSPDRIQSAGGYFERGLRYEWRTAHTGESPEGGAPYAVDLLPGCAVLYSRRALDQVGLFDERLFMYREDIDLSLRLAEANYRLYCVPAARVWHRRPATGTVIPPHVVYYMARNSLLLARKHRAAEAIRFLCQDITAWILWRTNPRWAGMEQQAAARADGVIDFFLGRLGRSQKWTPTGR